MKKHLRYRFVWLLLIIAVIAGCKTAKRINPVISLWRKDKNPYGTYYAFENLKYIFPNASSISVNKASPAKYTDFNSMEYSSSDHSNKTAYIIISPRVIPDGPEINALMNFVGDGNSVFISSFYIGDSLLNYLKVKTSFESSYFFPKDTMALNINSPVAYDMFSYQYPGSSFALYVDSMDKQYATVLGTDEKGRADFIRFNYKGGGAIYLHFSPLAFSNFFLLNKNNKSYYDNAFSYLPKSTTIVKWDDYFRYTHGENFSALKFLLSNPPFEWAFWLLLLLFLLVYLFESKRKQRVIPSIAPLHNSSVDFVKTIGRLYYQQKDNLNLADKMSAHFLGYIRSKYNLPTTSLDDEFTERLSYKSGYPKTLIKGLIDHIKVIQQQQSLTDGGLLELNNKIEEFYKHT